MSLALHELATDAARVLVANLVHLDGVVTAVEGDDELTVLIIGLSGDELGVEAEDVHILLEHLLHVDLRGLLLEGDDGAHGVSLSSVAVVGRDRLVLDGGGGGGELHGSLGDSELLLVPTLGEVITVVDLAVTAVDLDALTAKDVSGSVVLLSSEGHAWAVGQDGGLGELLSLEKLGEGSTATVLGVDLLHLDGSVAEEEVELVELVAAIVGVVTPEDVEAKDTTIVVEEALETTVGTATLQLDLNVVLELSLIGRNLLHVDHAAGVLEGICGVILGSTDILTLLGVVGAGELVTVDDAEDTSVDVEVNAESEIGPVVVSGAVRLEELGALQEDALRNSGVGDTRLDDMESVVIKVEVDGALSDAEVLSGVLDDGLKEVRLEVEDLWVENKGTEM